MNYKGLLYVLALSIGCSLVSGKITSGKLGNIVIGEGATLNIDGDMTIEGNLIVEGGAVQFATDESSLMIDDGVYTNNGFGSFRGTYHVTKTEGDEIVVQLTGGERMEMLGGSWATRVQVSDRWNYLSGDINIFEGISLLDANSRLNYAPTTENSPMIRLNGGRIYVDAPIVFTGGFFEGPGEVYSGEDKVIATNPTGFMALGYTAGPLVFRAITLQLHNHVFLAGDTSWTFKNDGVIDGGGFTLDFINGASLVIADDASLTLSNITLKNVREGSIVFGLNSQLILSDATLSFASDVSYNQGVIGVYGPTTFELNGYKLFFTGTYTDNIYDDEEEYIIRTETRPLVQLYVVDAVLSYASPLFDLVGENEEHISLALQGRKNGLIRDLRADMARQALVIVEDTTFASHYLLDGVTTLTFDYVDDSALTLSMDGYRIDAQSNRDGIVSVSSELESVTFEGGVFDNYAPRLFSFTDAPVVIRFAEGMRLRLGGDEALTHAVRLGSGLTVIDGKGYVLDLAGYALICENYSNVVFKNITLRGVTPDSLLLASVGGSVSFDNVTIELSRSFSWNASAFSVVRDLTICGGKTFSYTSSEASTIESTGVLTIGERTMFSYAPANGRIDGLVCTDSGSTIVLDAATLRAPSTGMQLLRGTVVCKNGASIESRATSVEQALIFGDGSNVENDVTVKILEGQSLSLKRGYITIADALSVG